MTHKTNMTHRLYVKTILATILLSMVFAFPVISLAQTGEVINSFRSEITLDKQGTAVVLEQIDYNFGTNERHGIFRDIPLTAQDGPDLYIEVIGVGRAEPQAEDYISEPYTTSESNNIYNIRIGDPNLTHTGLQSYGLHYQVKGTIREFPDHDEFYWNVSGDKWQVVKNGVGTTITLPELTPEQFASVKGECFTGPLGSKDKNCTLSVEANPARVIATSTGAIAPGSDMSVVVWIPKGVVQNAYRVEQKSRTSSSGTSTENRSDDSFAGWIFAFVMLIVGVSVGGAIMRNKHRKPKPLIPKELRGVPITVEYAPPDKLSPIDVGTLLDRQVDLTDISSIIIDLAVRGYLKIKYTTKEIPLWPDKKDFEFHKLKDIKGLTHPAEIAIFDRFFGIRDIVSLSQLQKEKTSFQGMVTEVKKDVEGKLANDGYIDKKKSSAQKFAWLGTVGMIIIYIVMRVGVEQAKTWMALLAIAGFFVFISLAVAGSAGVLNRISKLSKQGVDTLAKILGFREYLSLVDADKLALMNAPSVKPETFEKYLAYAMVLGVEDEWAKKFEGIYNQIPDWYDDPNHQVFTSYMLLSNLHLFDSSFNSVFLATTPRSSSSGFGGGGFSGGGSGGGGGGSW